MKFLCEECGAQYMIADDKIGPRGVKVRCKKCPNVIILRPPNAERSAADRVSTMPSLTPHEAEFGDDLAADPTVAAAQGVIDQLIKDTGENSSDGVAGPSPDGTAPQTGPFDSDFAEETADFPAGDDALIAASANPSSTSMVDDLTAPAAPGPVETPSDPLGLQHPSEAPAEFETPASQPPSAIVRGVPEPEPDRTAEEGPLTLNPSDAPPAGDRTHATPSDDPGALTGSRAEIESAVGSALDTMFGETGAYDADDHERIAAERALAGSDPEPTPAQWFVAVQDQQVGPLSFDELQRRWDVGDVGPDTLCWKHGMADWIAMRFVQDLAGLDKGGRPLEAATLEPAPGATSGIALDLGGDERAPSDPNWRPTAGASLATLAAREMASISASPVDTGGPKSGGISELLDSGDKVASALGASSNFGAADLSSSRIMRPLPKTTDAPSTVSLRESEVPQLGRQWGRGVAIVLGLLVASAAAYAGLRFMTPAPPATETGVAVVTPPPPTTPPTEKPTQAPPSPEGSQTPEPVATQQEEKKAAPSAPPKKKQSKQRSRSSSKTKSTARPKAASKPTAPSRSKRVTKADLLPSKRSKSTESANRPKQLSSQQVLKVLKQHGGDISNCRKKQRQDDPDLTGTMTVKMTIRRTGRVSSPSVAPRKFKKSVLGKCVLRSAKTWRFPEFTGPSLPIDFPVRMGKRR